MKSLTLAVAFLGLLPLSGVNALAAGGSPSGSASAGMTGVGGHAGGSSAGMSVGRVGSSGLGGHSAFSRQAGTLRSTSFATFGTSGRYAPASRVSVASRPITASQGAAFEAPISARATAPLAPANSWTDASAGRPGRSNTMRTDSRQTNPNLSNESDLAYRSYVANGNPAGVSTPSGFAASYRYPGAYSSALNSYYNGISPRGAYGYGGTGAARNFAQYERWYGPNAGYHRWWPNGYLPYFGPYAYPYFGSAFGYPYYGSDINSVGDSELASGDHSVATFDDGEPTQGPAAGAELPNPPATEAVMPPVNPGRSATAAIPGNGPDSLIEAVQAELARRGYFRGTVDSMYGPSTREAIRRFQEDVGLAATGRINEATMHALQLD